MLVVLGRVLQRNRIHGTHMHCRRGFIRLIYSTGSRQSNNDHLHTGGTKNSIQKAVPTRLSHLSDEDGAGNERRTCLGRSEVRQAGQGLFLSGLVLYRSFPPSQTFLEMPQRHTQRCVFMGDSKSVNWQSEQPPYQLSPLQDPSQQIRKTASKWDKHSSQKVRKGKAKQGRKRQRMSKQT